MACTAAHLASRRAIDSRGSLGQDRIGSRKFPCGPDGRSRKVPMDIGEIARRAGVSRSTVSYALSGKRAVSAATRRRIEAVVAEAGYVPNANARALKEGRTRTLGLVIPPASERLTDMQLGFVA